MNSRQSLTSRKNYWIPLQRSWAIDLGQEQNQNHHHFEIYCIVVYVNINHQEIKSSFWRYIFPLVLADSRKIRHRDSWVSQKSRDDVTVKNIEYTTWHDIWRTSAFRKSLHVEWVILQFFSIVRPWQIRTVFRILVNHVSYLLSLDYSSSFRVEFDVNHELTFILWSIYVTWLVTSKWWYCIIGVVNDLMIFKQQSLELSLQNFVTIHHRRHLCKYVELFISIMWTWISFFFFSDK